MQNNISYPEQGAEFGDEEEDEAAATAMEGVTEALPAGEATTCCFSPPAGLQCLTRPCVWLRVSLLCAAKLAAELCLVV